VLGLVAAVGAAVLGVAFARAVDGGGGTRALPAPVLAVAAAACLLVIALPMRRPTGDVSAHIRVEPASTGTAFVTATLSPADAADDAYWFQASAWQGGGLELADMEPTGEPGEFRSSDPVPVEGHWKTLLRLHRGAEMMAVPVYLPADPSIDKPEIPAVDRTAPFVTEREYLLRETHSGSRWMAPVVHFLLLLVCALWAVAFAYAVHHLSRRSPASASEEALTDVAVPSEL
jgi:hypothetical protein